MNHETSTVPFPYTLPNPDINNSKNDFDNAQLSHLVLKNNLKVVSGELVDQQSSANYQRFCSNFLTARGGRVRGPSAPVHATRRRATRSTGRGRRGRQGRRTGPTPNRPAWPWPTTRRPETTVRSMAWAGPITRTRWPSPGSGEAVLRHRRRQVRRPLVPGVHVPAADADAVWDDQGHLFAFQSDDGDRQRLRRPARSGSSVAGHVHRRAGRRRRRRPDRPGERGQTRTTCSSSSGSRTSPTTATTRRGLPGRHR